ncbi:hypothetical protein [Polymorphobacter megasporae]|uniref:hypothetical protein n=1 Tax=Glacieibacterium megasporae TaxID=2835787 RepID=UPI001CAA4785|nr:hypothetical protein [Polymorphobacter megasporae]UAJ10634.1 hypothetical protein KTC28_02440 [Polymorphobacter megasporae]
MLLNLSATAAVLMRMHGMPIEHRGAMLARLQHFLRLGFPFVRTRRASISIGIEEALKLAFAFELADAGFAPTRAVRLLQGDWVPIRSAIAQAWSEMSDTTADGPSGTELEIFPNALAEIASAVLAADAPLHEAGGLVVRDSAGAPSRVRAPGPVLRVDVGRMAARLGAAVVIEGLAPAQDVQRAFEAFADDVLGPERISGSRTD